jgi:hypothetical protein
MKWAQRCGLNCRKVQPSWSRLQWPGLRPVATASADLDDWLLDLERRSD